MHTTPKQIKMAEDERGRVPFKDWIEALDLSVRGKIEGRLARVSLGNLGDSASVGDGVQELKMNTGPGYRIYYALHGLHIVVLLGGGDKGSQQDDIRRAKRLWEAWQRAQDV